MNTSTSLLVATVRNEGPNLLEWVAHHRLCGFDRIQIFENGSTDMSVRTLRQLDELGFVEFHDMPDEPGDLGQRACRLAAQTETYHTSDWCMVLDINEFLAVKTGGQQVADLINACPEDADAILVNWRVFGSSGQRTLTDDLVTRRFTQAEPAQDIKEDQPATFRSLFRTEAFQRPGCHLPHGPTSDAPLLCNGSGLRAGEFERKNWRSFDPKMRALAQVNHYATRDLESFILKEADQKKDTTSNRPTAAALWAQRNRNEEEDLLLAKRADVLQTEMARLDDLSDGRLMRLRTRSQRQKQKSLDQLLENGDAAALRNTLLAWMDDKAPTESPVTTFRLPQPKPTFATSRNPKSEDPFSAAPIRSAS